ncbi:peptide-methionine (S)-S-oxide reductase MsrA [Thioalkalivibrio sp.]|uniref:peptide-methionine (S)-S-oxide reductase MsrA n=1 Tax=Thioalkalivibrio sp. TaxID=2093813 RepID=UPI0012D5F879|nr:peptide-methionine (S)-S-oxide reductase MsrA [Thioalkalivibrio sp.]TVP78688.1 MAG: peptide-methionine (S)-S-oxide reductase [Thioalkalivibrio sp.]
MNEARRVLLFTLALPLLAILASAGAFADDDDRATALFAGGCFWCVEKAFDQVDGVVATTSGFTGGHVEYPSYEQVVAGDTGHYESVLVEYDPAQVSYEELLYAFWRNIDPLDGGGQFCDRGSPYRAAIFAGSEEEYRAAAASKEELARSDRFDEPIATEILDRDTFYAAEEYHQNYYQKNPLRYRFYVTTCRRYARLDQIWGDEARPGVD